VLLPQLLHPSIAMIIFFAIAYKNKLPRLKMVNKELTKKYISRRNIFF